MAALQPLLVCETLTLVEIDWNQWIWWKEATIDRRDSTMASVDRLLMRKVSDVEEGTSRWGSRWAPNGCYANMHSLLCS